VREILPASDFGVLADDTYIVDTADVRALEFAVVEGLARLAEIILGFILDESIQGKPRIVGL